MPSRFLSELARRILVFDGAMGASILAMNLSVEHDFCGCENCTDILVRTRPDIIQSIHESFLAAGCDAVETDTFGANKLVLAEFGLEAETYALNKRAAEVARAACEKYSTPDKPRFVAGSIGPGTKLLTLGNTTWKVMFDSYREQARGLIDGGADVLIVETCQDLLQVKCALNGVLAAMDERKRSPDDIPIMASVTIETTGTMLLGTEIAAAAAALAGYPIVSLGLNCATGPTEMTEHIRWLGEHWGGPALGTPTLRVGSSGARAASGGYVSVMPNAGLPVLVNGKAEFPLKPAPFVEAMTKFIERDGVNIVGGCCGTTPEHIRPLVEAVESIQKRGRTTPAKQPPAPACTSLYSPTEYRQDASFLIVGERMNASGSRKFKRLLEAEDFDGIVSLAREQVRERSHVLDINVDYAGRDNALDMAEVVKRVVRQVDAPLMIDSTQSATIEAGLEHAPGKCLINSTNFEDGEHKFDLICSLAKKYGAGVVIGSIDEDKQASMARTADRKESIAARAFERATTLHGLSPADVLFDPLVLPISTGMEADRKSALETIEGTRRIRARFPESQIVVGLSNVSFGLKEPARVVLNSVFLHELLEAGLTAAIVHSSKILPRNKIPDEQWNAALDLIYDRRTTQQSKTSGPGVPPGSIRSNSGPGVPPGGLPPVPGSTGGTPVPPAQTDPLQTFIALFTDATAAAHAKEERKPRNLEERLRAHIVDGEKEGLVACLEEARAKYRPLDIINDHLLDGMKTVGDLFGSGQMQLPFVLQSAEVMKMAVAHLEQFMERAAGQTKGTIVLATVKGDVHDIGKNLVDIILTNNGYTVFNLGIKQPIADIIKAFKEKQADAIGLSGLLVKSVNVMEENLKELNTEKIDVPVLLGGAALSRNYCESHLRSTYNGQCFYGKDAFEGLRVMDHIVGGQTAALRTEIDQRLGKRAAAEEVVSRSRIQRMNESGAAGGAGVPPASGVAVAVAQRSDTTILPDDQIPKPPFFGTRSVTDLDLDSIYPFINPIALFRGQWQVKKGPLADAQYEALLQDTVHPVFERLKKQCKDEKILRPAVVYGYFPCNADGNDLIIYDPERAPTVRERGSSTVARGDANASPHSLTLGALREIERFTFPRQESRKRLCISDFFLPAESGRPDVIGLHCVTMGSAVSEAARALFARNEYTEYLYLHGLGVETAEALAEMWHKRMRQELGIAGEDSPRIKELFTQHYRGSRYSFGYPACPEMSDQGKLWRLLKPERIGCVLTENWQIDPEQSTSAIIVHHPEAKYFNV